MTDLALFDAEPYHVPAQPAETVSADRRRTIRQAAQLARGLHPVALRPLHADAAPHDDRQAEGLRCNGCRFRFTISGGNRTYPKCGFPVDKPEHGGDWDRMHRVSHGAASDVRGWWPACRDYQPRDGAR